MCKLYYLLGYISSPPWFRDFHWKSLRGPGIEPWHGLTNSLALALVVAAMAGAGRSRSAWEQENWVLKFDQQNEQYLNNNLL